MMSNNNNTKNLMATSTGTLTSTTPGISSIKKERRRAKRKAASSSKDEAPMFLRKAFHIVNTCDPAIATWSEDGLSFHVKDQDRFATEIIPKCFKHNHFSSFVRQLNFYGFRKLREDHIELDSVDESKSKWCHFRHPKFRRGRPDLLKEISKNTHKEVAEKTELDALRSEVKDLKALVHNMKKDMTLLASLVGDLTHQQQQRGQPPLKKQRLAFEAKPDTAKSNKNVPPKPVSLANNEKSQSGHSTISFNSEDDEFLSSLFTDEGFDGDLSIPDAVLSA